MSLKIVFMGTPDFAVPALKEILKQKLDVVHVYTQPPKKSNRGLKLEKTSVHLEAEKNNLKVHHPSSLKNEGELDIFKKINPDLVIVVAYGQIIPENFLNLSKKGFINIHASLLPNWRGAAPIQRAIMNGDKFTGISIMKIEKGLDSGPVMLSEKIEINNELNYGLLSEKLSVLGAKLIIKAIDLIEKDKAKFSEQDHSKATHAKKITKDDEEINWNQNAEKIVQQINALNPTPGAFFQFNNEKIKIWKAETVNEKGTIGTAMNDNLLIACKNSALQVLEIQRPGKKVQKIKEFLLGFKIPKASKLF
jgi:methionyl-tRNA formyltransferase